MANEMAGESSNCLVKNIPCDDLLPPSSGKLRLYTRRCSPYGQRVKCVLNAKNIDYDVVILNPENYECLKTKSPHGKIPFLEIKENSYIYESIPIITYLDKTYTNKRMLPKDPVQRAYDKIIVEVFEMVISHYNNVIRTPGCITDENTSDYHKSLGFIQDQLRSRGTRFVNGPVPGYADYAMWPWFERLMACKDYDERLNLDPTKYSLLLEYIQYMFMDPAVNDCSIPADLFVKRLIEDVKNRSSTDFFIDS